MFCTRVAWVCLVCVRLCKEEGSSPGSMQLLRGGIWAVLFGETIRKGFGCGCYFVAKCYGCV